MVSGKRVNGHICADGCPDADYLNNVLTEAVQNTLSDQLPPVPENKENHGYHQKRIIYSERKSKVDKATNGRRKYTCHEC